MNTYNEHKIAELFLALGQPNRIRILNLLRQDPVLCACEMQNKLNLEQSNLSRHLSTLADAGVLIRWKDGVRTNYKIADPLILELLDKAEKTLHQDDLQSTG